MFECVGLHENLWVLFSGERNFPKAFSTLFLPKFLLISSIKKKSRNTLDISFKKNVSAVKFFDNCDLQWIVKNPDDSIINNLDCISGWFSVLCVCAPFAPYLNSPRMQWNNDQLFVNKLYLLNDKLYKQSINYKNKLLILIINLKKYLFLSLKLSFSFLISSSSVRFEWVVSWRREKTCI